MSDFETQRLYNWYWETYFKTSAHIQYGRYVAALYLDKWR